MSVCVPIMLSVCVSLQVFVSTLKRMRKLAIDVRVHCDYISVQGARVNIYLQACACNSIT